MLGSVVLDVAIGMVFLYLLLSLIASAIAEIFASVLQTRAANLQRGIRSLLSEDSICGGITLAESLYKHGLIRGLYQDPFRDYNIQSGLWIKFRMLLQKVFRVSPPKEIAGIANPLLLPAYIPSRTFAVAMIDLLERENLGDAGVMQRIGEFLNGHHAEFADNKAVEALLALVRSANGDVEKFQTSLENWYNDAMDRVSGWYKKYSQNVLLVVGLALAVAFNVDSISVARVLWLDRDARQDMVNAASDYLGKHGDFPGTSAPAQPAGGTATSSSAAAPPADPAALRLKLQTTVQTLKDVGSASLLPVGWSDASRAEQFRSRWTILSTIGGWLITAVALSLGAPFWFDTLNKFMVVRSTIKPQEKSQPEASKD